jgi:hypothetical protein
MVTNAAAGNLRRLLAVARERGYFSDADARNGRAHLGDEQALSQLRCLIDSTKKTGHITLTEIHESALELTTDVDTLGNSITVMQDLGITIFEN